jgi:hypothetical protein
MRVVDESIVDIEDGHLRDERRGETGKSDGEECGLFVCLLTCVMEEWGKICSMNERRIRMGIEL